MSKIRLPNPAMIVALLALFVALGGTAVAAGVVPLARRALLADNAKKLNGLTAAQIAAGIQARVAVKTGIYPKRPVGGRVSWTWKVGTRTTPGRWPIVVSCGSAGTLRTSFVVR